MLKLPFRLWLGMGVLSFCFSSAAARAQQQNPFVGMIQGLDLSPMNVGAVPCRDFKTNDCSDFNKPYPVPVDAIKSGPITRVSTQIWAAIGAFVERATSQGMHVGEQRILGTYYKLFGDAKEIVTCPHLWLPYW